MIIFPQAKINLGLRVLRKRADGYHDIDTCMLSIPVRDVLEIIADYPQELRLSGIKVAGDVESNLCWKAYQLIRANHNIPETYFHLMKLIPMGAGLGGGSSDAAAVIVGLNKIYSLNLPESLMEGYAAELGSDCPFFVSGKPQIAKGRGEMLSKIEIDLNGYYLKLVNPGIHVGTAEAYAGVIPNDNVASVEEILTQDIRSWKETLVNDFEISVFRQFPEVGKIKDELYREGAIYAAMSGSGSTLFGLFESEPHHTFANQYYEKVVQL